ncbi:MAG: hypothetical protein JWP29_3216, partial [Rhodoferax sp.]|nr:hypothetical protein [Rhodoferax sp.]
YAKGALDAASAKLGSVKDTVKDKAAELQASSAQYVQAEPMKALLIAAAAGAIIAALLINARGGRGYGDY